METKNKTLKRISQIRDLKKTIINMKNPHFKKKTFSI